MKHVTFLMLALIISATPIAAQDIPLSKILVEKEGWREVVKAPVSVNYLSGMADGTVKVFRDRVLGSINSEGKWTPDNRPDFGGHNIAYRKHLYSIKDKRVEVLLGEKFQPLELKGLVDPVCIQFWPDEGHLVIGESDGAYLWAVRIEKNGSFGPGDRYYSLRTKPNEKMHVTSMVMDAGYLLYACTPLGIQVFDPTGRLSGVIAAPSKESMTAITIGGAKADELFVAAGDKIFARRIQGKASYTLKK